MTFNEEAYLDLLYQVIHDKTRHGQYEQCCEHAEEMAWHIYGDKPDKLLKRARPREDPEITDYRLENYEPETKAAADKAINIFSKMFNPVLYSIIWPKSDRSNELRDYTTQYYPEYNSLISFNKDVALRKKFADPNAIFAVRPEKFPDSQTEELKPIVVIYGSKNIWFQDVDHYLLFRRKEIINNRDYYYFEYFDFQFWRRFVVTVNPNESTVTILEDEEYEHNFKDKFDNDAIPCWKLGGIPDANDDGTVIYKSYISSATPDWNLAIIHASDVLGAYIQHLHPQRWALGEECQHMYEFEGMPYPCKNGRINYPGGPVTGMVCPKCEGRGRVLASSPYETNIITKDKLDQDLNLPNPPMGYTNVPTDATKMVEDRVKEKIRRGMWAINMDIEDEIGENQSGIAKVIDRSAQFDTMFNVAAGVFDVDLSNQIYFINLWMFGVSDLSRGQNSDQNLPEINKPTQFDIQSVSELVNNFDTGKKSGLDPNYLQTQQAEIVNKDLGTNPTLKERTLLILKLDPFPGKTPDEIDLISRYARKTDIVIHFNISDFIDRALEEEGDFKEKTKKEQKLILEGYAQEVIDEMQMSIDAATLSPEL